MNNLYKYKNLDLGIVILCPNLNIGHLRNTVSSAEVFYPKSNIIIVLPGHCKKEDLEITSKIKKSYKAGKNTASMLNCGMKHASPEWNFILLSKGWMRNRLDIKYSYFIENEKDILFPITSHKTMNFADADINGLLIHHKTFKAVGELVDMEDTTMSKLLWATKAIEEGCKFKGIVGAKVF